MYHVRKVNLFVSLLCLAPFLATECFAQGSLKRDSRLSVRQTEVQVRNIKKMYSSEIDSLISRYRSWQYMGSDVLSNPYYSSLLGSPTLYHSTIHKMVGEIRPDLYDEDESSVATSRHIYDVVNATDNNLLTAYAHYPWFVCNEEVERGTLNVDKQIKESVKPEMSLTDRLKSKDSINNTIKVMPGDNFTIEVRKPNFWNFKTNFSFHYTQNYVSKNWYKGGESYNSLLASMTVEANFNNRQKLTFDNRLEMKLGFQTSHNDEKHKFKTNSDLIRLTNKLGFCAIKDWYYTIMLQSWTQFYRGYKANDTKVYSDFMSPFESMLSIGMDYKKVSKNNKFSITAAISPLALKVKYVDRSSLATSFGLSEGHHAKWEHGPNITMLYNWAMFKNVKWNGRIYFFTDYSKTQVEWENTFELTINKYLKTKLFLYPRFDDSRVRKEGESYFQFNELLSFGLDLSF